MRERAIKVEPEPFGWVIGGVELFFLGMGKEEQRKHERVCGHVRNPPSSVQAYTIASFHGESN